MIIKRLAGQQELHSRLAGALEAEKLNHAILLTGPSGSGKKSWGKLLAQAILCPERSGIEPCMQCFSCRSFLSGNHPEYFFVEPDKRWIKIEQIRIIRESFYLRGSRKVCLINHAEMMTAEASSSLLKVLEEPPPGLHFILLAEKPQLLYDTILSRCQQYTLQPLSGAEIIELLINERAVTKETAVFLARISGGLPGHAFKLADDEKFEERFNEAKTLVEKLASGRDSALQLLSWAALLADRIDLIPLLELVCLLCRDGLIQKLCRREECLPEPVFAPAWIGNISPAGLEEAVLLINETIYQINATNVNRRLLLDKMLILLQRRLSQCPELSGFDSGRPGRPITLNPVQIY